jgi:hypothetical protein
MIGASSWILPIANGRAPMALSHGNAIESRIDTDKHGGNRRRDGFRCAQPGSSWTAATGKTWSRACSGSGWHLKPPSAVWLSSLTQAFALCPYGREVVFGYTGFLLEQNRADHALRIAHASLEIDPGARPAGPCRTAGNEIEMTVEPSVTDWYFLLLLFHFTEVASIAVRRTL